MTAIGDTSCLEVFTRIRGLGLLAPWSPIRISRDIIHEHETTAPPEAHAYLLQAIEQGKVVVEPPRQADIVVAPRHHLSPVDLAGLAWAKATGEWLLVDDREMCDAARLNGIDFLDVPAIIRALQQARALDPSGVKRVAAAVHFDAGRELGERDQKDFGLV